METMGVTEFKQHCLRILEDLGPEGLLITKHGKPLAKITRVASPHAEFIGILKNKLEIREGDNLFSTGAWVSDEWEANNFDD